MTSALQYVVLLMIQSGVAPVSASDGFDHHSDSDADAGSLTAFIKSARHIK